MNLRDIESYGIQLRVEAGQLAVDGPSSLLTDDRIETLRRHKQELIDQVLLRDFCQLVRAYGTDHHALLDDAVIMQELDAADLACLREIDRVDKQSWAQMLAYRLTHSDQARTIH